MKFLGNFNIVASFIIHKLNICEVDTQLQWNKKKNYKNIENDSKIYGMAYVVRLRMKEKSFHFYGNDFHVSC